MAFRDVFIGIDRYASSKINWLSCAVRDATAMHALFSDTFGDRARILTDQQATKAEIEKEFSQLVTCSEDDVVVFFSLDMAAHTNSLHMTLMFINSQQRLSHLIH